MTPEQIQAGTQMLIGLQQALLPAELKNTHANGYTIVNEVVKRGLSFTTESAVRVVNEILFENKLDWNVKPAKLVREEKNARPATQQTAEKALQPFLDKKAAAEKAEAKAKADEASVKQAKELIASYFPTKSTLLGQKLDHGEQAEMQAEWTAALGKAITMKVDLQSWVKMLSATIQKRYADRERSSERL